METKLTTYRIIYLNILFVGILALTSCGNSKKVRPAANKVNSEIVFKDYFHMGNSEKMIGHLDSAEVLFKKCIEIKPNSSAAYYALSDIYLQNREVEKSLEFGNLAYKMSPENKWYAMHLADIYYGVRDYEKSAKYYEDVVVKFEEKNIDVKSRLAESYIYSNQREKAIAILNQIELENGKTTMSSLTKYDLLNDLDRAEEANQELKALFDEYPNDIGIAEETMNYFLQTRQVEPAKKAIAHLLAIDSSNGNAYIGLAEMALTNNNISETFDYLEKGIISPDIDPERKMGLLQTLTNLGLEVRDPNSSKINERVGKLYQIIYPAENENAYFLYLYGTYLIYNDQVDSARTMYKKSTELYSSNHIVWMDLLEADYILDQFDNLKKDGNKALELFPSQPVLYLLTGIGYFETEEWALAEEMFSLGEDLIVMNDNMSMEDKMSNRELKAEFEFLKAKNKWRQGETKAANEHFESVFKLAPTTAKFHYEYAELMNGAGQKDKAIIHAKKSCQLEQKNPIYLFLYAQLLFDEKNYQLSQMMIEKAIGVDIHNSEYFELYGDIIFFLGNTEKAVKIWEEAYTINTSPRLKQKIDTRKYNEN